MKISTFRSLKAGGFAAFVAWACAVIVAAVSGSQVAFNQLFQVGVGAGAGFLMWNLWRKHRVVFLAIVVAAVLSLIAPAHAMAQTATQAGQATTVPMDEWINPHAGGANNLICATIGDPGGLGLFGCQGKTTAVWEIIKTFNLLALAFGALYFAWNSLAMTVTSASEGEFLGKRSSSAWVPIRSVMGAGLLIPAFSGWNLAQLAMAWATAVGIGAANIAASGVAPAFSWGATYAAPMTPNASSVRLELSAAMTCVANFTQYGREVAEAEPIEPYPQVPFVVTTASTQNAVSVSIGGAPGNAAGWTTNHCGWIKQTLPSMAAGGDAGAQTIATALRAAILTALPTLANEYVSSGMAIGRGTMTMAQAEERIAAAEAAYNVSLKTAVAQAVSSVNSAAAAAQVQFGDWTSLGFQNLMATQAAVTVTQTATAKNSSGFAGHPASTTEGHVGASSWLDVIRHPIDHLEATLNDQANDLGQYVAEMITSFSGQSPLSALQHLGINLMVWVGAMFAFALIFPALVAAAAGPVLAVAGALPLVGGAAETIATIVGATINSTMNVFIVILSIFGIPLLYFGFKAGAIIPFMVAVAWVGAVFGWLAVVFEAMFGAPLWAIVHLDTDGDGLGGRTNHGYLFILNLIFRPIMLVGALALAQLAMTAIFALFGAGLASMISAMTTSAGQWFTKLLLIVGAVIVIVQFAEQIVSMCLSLLYEIPTRVFAFIGGQFGSDLGAAANAKLSSPAPGQDFATQSALRRAGAHNRDLSSEVNPATGKMGNAQEQANKLRQRFGLKRGKSSPNTVSSGV